jgi:glycosyltransferase involved in cell wall biosynthesis
VEALSCGVPCVAFDIGGMSDLVYEKEMGYLAQPYDIKDFAEGVLMLLKNKKMRRKKIAKLARNKFDSSLIAAEHITLYARIVQESGSK